MNPQENKIQLLYFATDGDEIGKRHAQALLSDNIEEISNISESITAANEMVQHFFESNSGRKISLGGDEGVFEAPAEIVGLLEQLRKDYQYMVGATLSIGYGSKPSEAAKALLSAKETGKNKIVQYDKNIESELGSQSGEGEQSGENQSDMPHQESQGDYNNEVGSDGIIRDDPPIYDNNHQYDSGYKDSSKKARETSYREEDLIPPVIAKPNLSHKPRVFEATSGDVPESNRPMNNEPANLGERPPKDKKPVSKYYEGQAEYASPKEGAPESMVQPNEDRPSDLKYVDKQNEPTADMPMEDATSDVAEATEAQDMDAEQHCPGCNCPEHGEQAESSMEDVLDQHIDNAKDFTNTIGEGGDQGNIGDGDGEGESIEDILDQHLDNAADMEGNGTVDAEGMDPNGISRPADYEQKQGDMGLSEEEAAQDEPQLDEVLRDGLDQHADGIQREKVVNMVGEALDAFKGQKKILDKAKEQAPELHSACISMLRAMIELCSLAGIDQSQPEAEVNEIEGGDVPEESLGAEDESESCPNCGHEKAKPAAPQEGQQESPQH